MEIGELALIYRRLNGALEGAAREVANDWEDEKYDVDDLVIRDPLEEVQTKLDELVQRWQELDKAQATVRKRKLHQAGASYVSIPDGFDPLNPAQADLSTYEGKLAELMREVPRLRELKKQLEDADTKMMQLKRVIDAAPDAPNMLKELTRGMNYIGLAEDPKDGVAVAATPPADDIVLSVTVCSPKTPHERTQEIEFLGSQSVLEIGRHIVCLRRHLDESETDCGWLFVEGQFYAAGAQAARDADSVRLWCAENIDSVNGSLGLDPERPTSIHAMETTTFQQLSMRLGVRYVYVHSGNCQHFLYLMEARDVHPSMDTRPFPRVVFQTKIRKRKCDICALWTARFTVVNDKLADRTPSFQCEHCYHMLHYSADGELLYRDFEVYPYVHDIV